MKRAARWLVLLFALSLVAVAQDHSEPKEAHGEAARPDSVASSPALGGTRGCRHDAIFLRLQSARPVLQAQHNAERREPMREVRRPI